MKSATRTLTVSALFRQRQDDVVPSIRLSGKWLAMIVKPGQRICVTVTADSITIEPIAAADRREFLLDKN
jgi:hypothetical protein